jgi:hypothetical protein
MKGLPSGHLCFLLDGFDEIGSQAWSENKEKLRLIRQQSLEGIRDLISKSQGGFLICGREHYFNNNEEMFNALGVKAEECLVFRCKQEFTETEFGEFIAKISEDLEFPHWLPRRPLICQIVATLSVQELEAMFAAQGGDVQFWNRFMEVLSERDARIKGTFDGQTIKRVLMALARFTRSKAADVGPLWKFKKRSRWLSVSNQSKRRR